MIAYRNIKLPSTASRTGEAESIARHEPNGWKCDDWRSEADRIMGMRQMQAARKVAPLKLLQRKGYVRVEFEF